METFGVPDSLLVVHFTGLASCPFQVIRVVKSLAGVPSFDLNVLLPSRRSFLTTVTFRLSSRRSHFTLQFKTTKSIPASTRINFRSNYDSRDIAIPRLYTHPIYLPIILPVIRPKSICQHCTSMLPEFRKRKETEDGEQRPYLFHNGRNSPLTNSPTHPPSSLAFRNGSMSPTYSKTFIPGGTQYISPLSLIPSVSNSCANISAGGYGSRPVNPPFSQESVDRKSVV